MYDLKGLLPESWNCIDCGIHTAPGCTNRIEAQRMIALEQAVGKGEEDWRIKQTIDDQSELYMVRDAVWKAAGMEPMGGCLCIGCLEKRIGHKLKPKDFDHSSPFNRPDLPGTERLLDRRGRAKGQTEG